MEVLLESNRQLLTCWSVPCLAGTLPLAFPETWTRGKQDQSVFVVKAYPIKGYSFTLSFVIHSFRYGIKYYTHNQLDRSIMPLPHEGRLLKIHPTGYGSEKVSIPKIIQHSAPIPRRSVPQRMGAHRGLTNGGFVWSVSPKEHRAHKDTPPCASERSERMSTA